MKFVYTITFFFVLFSLNSQAQNVAIDSMLQMVKNEKGEGKLKILESVAIQKANTPDQWTAAVALERESRMQNSDTYLAKAYYHKLYYVVNLRMEMPYDSISYYANEAIAAFAKSKSIDGRAKIERILNKYLIDNANYELALRRAELFLKDVSNDIEEATAYELLGTMYLYLFQGKESIEMLKRGIIVCDRNSTDPLFDELNILLYFILFQSYSMVEDYDLALNTVDTLICRVMKSNDRYYGLDRFLFDVNIRKMDIYLSLKQYDMAAEMLKSLESYEIPMNSEEYSALLENGYASYYQAIKKYDKALYFSNKSLHFFTKDRNIVNHIILLKLNTEILDSLSNYMEASQIKSEIIHMSDSVNRMQMGKQLAQMNIIYQVEKINLEKEQKELKLQKAYIVGIALSVICLLAILLFIFEKRNSKRLREKNKRLFEQYKHIPLNEISNYISQPIAITSDVVDKQKIYNKVVEYLLATQQYVDAELSREALALQVGTNRQYLIEAIQENAEMTYSEFLSHLRLEHARKLLLQDNGLTIEKIYQQSGFSNKSTFYKHFGHKYGMTPAEFKSFVNEENVKSN